MALDVTPIQTLSKTPDPPRAGDSGPGAQVRADEAAPRGEAPLPGAGARAAPGRVLPSDLEATIRDIKKVSEAFNRRLSFSVNQKLDQVVVKVIDNDTDKVVREIPPVELQHVYERIREAIGLLFDKSA